MSASPRLRQIAFAATDLTIQAEAFRTVLGLAVAHRDPWVAMFGLQNVVIPIGDRDFLEVVSPVVEDTSAGRYLQRHGGDGGYMLIFESADLGTLRSEVETLGIRVVQLVEDDQHTSLQLHPKDCDGIMMSLDSAGEHWLAAGPDWQEFVRTDVVGGLRAVEFAVANPGEVARKWARITGACRRGTTLSYVNLQVQLVAATGDGPGLRSIEIARGAQCPYGVGERHRICGVDFVFVDAAEAGNG